MSLQRPYYVSTYSVSGHHLRTYVCPFRGHVLVLARRLRCQGHLVVVW